MIQDAVTVFSVSKYMSLHPLAETKDVACLFYSQRANNVSQATRAASHTIRPTPQKGYGIAVNLQTRLHATQEGKHPRKHRK